MKLILAAIFFLTTSFPSPSGGVENFNAAKLSEKGQAAYRIVRETEIFALGGVGVAGTTSPVEKAVRVLIAEKHGAEALANLTGHATPEGKLLALYGLRCAAPAVYKVKLAEVRALAEPPAREDQNRKIGAGYVTVMSGCEIMPERWADVLNRVASATYPCPNRK